MPGNRRFESINMGQGRQNETDSRRKEREAAGYPEKQRKLFVGVIVVLLLILCGLLIAQAVLKKSVANRETQQNMAEVMPISVDDADMTAKTGNQPVLLETPAPTPEETLPIIITNTPTPTPSPSPTPSPTPTAEPTPTPIVDLAKGALKREGNLREAPSSKAKIKRQLKKNTKVIVHEVVLDDQNEAWYYLSVDESATKGWMRSYLVSLDGGTDLISALATRAPAITPTPEAIGNGMTNHAANLREIMNGRVLMEIKKGQKVIILAERKDKNGNDWLQVLPEGKSQSGFIRANLVDIENPDAILPRSEEENDSKYIGEGITNRAANVRAKPVQNGQVVRQLSQDVAVKILGRYSSDGAEWFEIETPSGRTHGFLRVYTLDIQEIKPGITAVPYGD